MSLLLALVLLASPTTAPLEAGQSAPFDGVLVSPERIEELIHAEAERDALKKQLATEKEISAAWQKLVESAPADDSWTDDPDLNRGLGFVAGVLFSAGAIVGGAWISGVADGAAGP